MKFNYIKYKKRKYQGGGSYTTSIQPKYESSSLEAKVKPIDRETYVNSIIQKRKSSIKLPEIGPGLTSETKALEKKINDIYAMSNQLTEVDMLTNSERFKTFTSRLNNVYSEVTENELRINEEAFNEASQKLKENGGESAFATIGNQMVVQDKKTSEIKTISPSEYMKDKENYAPLSGSQVKALRRDNPDFAFNNSLMLSIEQTVGTESIKSHLIKTLKNLGSQSQLYKNVNDIITEKMLTKQKLNSNNIKELENVYYLLNSNSQAQLKAKAAATLSSDATEEDLKNKAIEIMALTYAGMGISEEEYTFPSVGGSGDGKGGSRRTSSLPRLAAISAGFGEKSAVRLLNGKIDANSIGIQHKPLQNLNTIGRGDETVAGYTNINDTDSSDFKALTKDNEGLYTMEGVQIDRSLGFINQDFKGVLGYVFKNVDTGKFVTPYSSDPKSKEAANNLAAMSKELEKEKNRIMEIYKDSDNKMKAAQEFQESQEDIIAKYSVDGYKPTRVYFSEVAIPLERLEDYEGINLENPNLYEKVGGVEEEAFRKAAKHFSVDTENDNLGTSWVDSDFGKTVIFTPTKSFSTILANLEEIQYNRPTVQEAANSQKQENQ